jgi:arylsulfatase
VSAGPLRLFKGYLSEGGIRTPLIVSGRGVDGSGRISSAFTHVMDIPATILNTAGVSHPDTYNGSKIAPLQGKPLSPILDNSSSAVRGPSDWLGWELFGNRAIRQDNWKLLWICTPYGTGNWQLYDLNVDPGETTDLASVQPEVRDRLVKHWSEYAEANKVILPSSSPVCATVN